MASSNLKLQCTDEGMGGIICLVYIERPTNKKRNTQMVEMDMHFGENIRELQCMQNDLGMEGIIVSSVYIIATNQRLPERGLSWTLVLTEEIYVIMDIHMSSCNTIPFNAFMFAVINILFVLTLFAHRSSSSNFHFRQFVPANFTGYFIGWENIQHPFRNPRAYSKI
jgi:hypothetical protein